MSGTSSKPNSREPLNSPKFRAWATSVDLVSGGSDEVRSRLIAFSTPELRSDASSQFSTGILPSGTTAAQILLKMHQQQALVNPSRTHPSWFAALRSKLQPQTRHFMKHLSAKHEANGLLNSIMSDCVSSLWAERLVGDLEPQPDDPPAVKVVEGESRVKWLRRLVWCGRIKLHIAGLSEKKIQVDRTFFESMPTGWAELALQSIDSFKKTSKSRKNSLARLGLVTMASLSGDLDHRRRQWLLQHFPMELGFALAPWLRIGKPPLPADQISLERWILSNALKLAEGDTKLNPALLLQVIEGHDSNAVSIDVNNPDFIDKPARVEQIGRNTANELAEIEKIDPSAKSERVASGFAENSETAANQIEPSETAVNQIEPVPDIQPVLEVIAPIEETAGLVVEQDLTASDLREPEMDSDVHIESDAQMSDAVLSDELPLPDAALSDELPLFEDSIEILQMNHHDSGLFDLDMDDIMLDTDESQQIPPAVMPIYDDAAGTDVNADDESDSDDSSSSFALGDLQL